MATSIVWTVDYSGTPSADDQLAAKKLIREENARITQKNTELAAQTPPGTPIPLWPSGTGAELKASVKGIMGQNATNWWGSYTTQAREDITRIPPDKRDALLAAINARLNTGGAGNSIDDVITDVSS